MEKFNTIYKEKSLIVDCSNKNGMDLKKYLKEYSVYLDQYDVIFASNKKHVAVIGGGMSAEREVSFMSSNGIVNSLLELGYYVTFIDMGADVAQVLAKIKPVLVFNALHGTYGEDGCLPGLLNIMRIPYTGCGVMPSALALNKKKSHAILKVNGFNVANAKIIRKTDNIVVDPLPRPYVIKPISQGSSIGIQMVFEGDEFKFSDYIYEYGDEIIVEKYIKGREIQVAVLNGQALGTLEIKFLKGKKFYDYETKYVAGYAEHVMPAPIPSEIEEKIKREAERVCEVFGCDAGIIRVEFLYSEEENDIYILEINTHPGMTELSICPEIATLKQMSYTDLVREIISRAKFEL